MSKNQMSTQLHHGLFLLAQSEINATHNLFSYDEADNIHDGSDYYLYEELFLRMISICFIHSHNVQADECLYHLSRCKQDFFLSRQESENLMKCCKKGHLG